MEQIGLYHVKQRVHMNFQASLPCLHLKPRQEIGQQNYFTNTVP